MDRKIIDSITKAWQEAVSEKKKLDPVGKADADIDNDGDVDSSDEYLHKRRKAIGKAMKKEKDGEMSKCPDCEGSTENHDPDCARAEKADKKKVMDKETDESSCGTVNANKKMKKEAVSHPEFGYGEIIEECEDGFTYNVYFDHGVEFNVPADQLTSLTFEEGKTHAERTKGASPAEKWADMRKGKPAKDQAKDSNADNPEVVKDDEEGHQDALKIAKAGKQAKARPGDNRKGDTKIIPSPTPVGGK